ncbi:unnamed protein product [Lactuca virosa]|uniref:Eukaryotic translation initiation factor 3 subunit E N-terminal domain-containing protein n=1 Tax=Lactuca virosa TaxID=75947 RepID=A0AAU9MTY6_9ASTR|nr:unnamed protein product [Lactuca virosa]
MDIHKSLYHTEDFPQDKVDRRVEVVARLKSLEEAVAPLVTFLQNPSAVQELRADKQYNLQMLNDRYQSLEFRRRRRVAHSGPLRPVNALFFH